MRSELGRWLSAVLVIAGTSACRGVASTESQPPSQNYTSLKETLVLKWDNYYSIAEDCDVKAQDVISINGNKDLHPGSGVLVPEPNTCPSKNEIAARIEKNCTIVELVPQVDEDGFEIAQKYNANIAGIILASGLPDANTPVQGHTLRVPTECAPDTYDR